ncbi:dockerin type I domain-containing protein [Mucisphaera sp.]|uniref:dockerin type I domain-containing protein n=1 Tax=Mucisphaera sp. TaxID=2913024 RepID=UPI003D143B3B
MSRVRQIATFTTAFLAAVVSTPTAEALDYYRVGNQADATAITQPGLLLAGGGSDVDSAMSWFLDRVNGGDVVVIRASGSDGYNRYLYEQLPGTSPDSVETLVFRSRSDASNPFALNRLQNAEGIFIAGGDQSDYDAYWRNTVIEDILNQKALEGIPIGGTSAGLAILGSTSYVARTQSVTSQQALADPYHPRATLEHDFLTIPLLNKTVTDSHYTERNREGRLNAFMARILADTDSTEARAIGVDEGAAITIDRRGDTRYHGPVGRSATLLRTFHRDIDLPAGQPLDLEPILSYELTTGGSFDLTSWTANAVTASTATWFAYDNGNRIELGDLFDINNDSTIDAADIDALTSTPADLNRDGVSNPADRTYLIERVLGTTLGDANLDGTVNLTDLSSLASHFSQPSVGWSQADFDGSGTVDLIDLSLLASSFGFDRDANPAPEPQTAFLLLLLFALKPKIAQ